MQSSYHKSTVIFTGYTCTRSSSCTCKLYVTCNLIAHNNFRTYYCFCYKIDDHGRNHECVDKIT